MHALSAAPVVGRLGGGSWALFKDRDGAEARGALDIHVPAGDLAEVASKLFAPDRPHGAAEGLRTRAEAILRHYARPSAAP